MHRCATSKIAPLWDDSSDSFYSQASNDEATSLPPTPDDHITPQNPPPPLQHTPYQTPQPQPPRRSVMSTLKSWIIPRWAHQPPAQTTQLEVPPIIEIVPNNNPIQQPPLQDYHQTPLSPNVTNHHWGDQMVTPKPLHIFWIMSKNFNTFSMQQSYLQWQAASQAIASCKADAIVLQETNVMWHKIHKQKVWRILRKPTGHVIIATSSSTEISTKSHQCSGTLQALVGSWVSHATQASKDPSGLGWWSYIKLQSRDNKCFILLSGYCIHDNQTINMGSNNTFNQQYQLLHQQGNQNPDPHTQFIDNLISQINIWQGQKKAVLICINANNNPQKTSSQGVSRIFGETDLIDLHTVQYPNQTWPPTTIKAPHQ